ncbi:hypothetical protein NA892_14100, partial [Escherichia coli]|nr:hypothetical protein [Escherichia coli]
SGSGVKIAEGMKKTAPDGAVSGMPAIRETGPGKNLQAITVSTKHLYSICCNDRAGQISVAHLAILRLSSVLARLHSTLLIP